MGTMRPHPLIIPPDKLPPDVSRATLSEAQKLLYDMCTASSPDDEIILQTRKYLGHDVHIYKEKGKVMIQVGMSIPTPQFPEALPAYSCYKKTGGKNVSESKIWSTRIICGKLPTGQPRQIPLNATTNTLIKWTSQRFSLSMWLDATNSRKIGLTTNGDRADAWKRWLLRIWAGIFPDELLYASNNANDGDSTKSSVQAPSAKSKRDRKKKNLDDLAIDQEKANMEGDDDHVIDQVHLEAEYGIVRFSDWWEKFNLEPAMFKLDNPLVYLSIARSFLHDTDDEFTDAQLPPLQVLKAATERLKLPTRKNRTVEQTMSFSVWRSSSSLNRGDDFNLIPKPSLHELKMQGMARIEAEKVEAFQRANNGGNSSLEIAIECRWALTPDRLNRLKFSMDEWAKQNKAQRLGNTQRSRPENLDQAINEFWGP